MVIRYIDHSSFAIETGDSTLLFDWVGKGGIERSGNLYVFSSHAHSDHFNKAVFSLDSERYILSYDIEGSVPDRARDKAIIVHPGDRLGPLSVFGSTDQGVSFLLEIERRRVLFMGDNAAWNWDEDEEDLENVRRYRQILSSIGTVDIAFVPYDPRLGKHSMDSLLICSDICNPGLLVPMHMWGKYEIIDEAASVFGSRLMDIRKETMEI